MEKPCGVVLFTFLMVVILSTESSTSKLKEVYSWKQLNFQYPNDGMRQKQIDSGDFSTENIIPTGVEVWKNKLFVTLPRLKAGIPATLAYINLDGTNGEKSPKLIPYPDWETHQIGRNGPRIISVHHVNVDACDRLWMFDTGLADYLGDQKQVLPPRILVYDLKTDKLINEHEVRKEHRKSGSCLASLASVVVDVIKGKCDEAFAYVSDSDAAGFVAYDLKKKASWRVDEPFYRFEALPENGNLPTASGVFGIGLKPLDGHHSTYYFHPLSNLLESGTNILGLRNKTIEDTNYKYTIQVWQGPETQSLGEITDVLLENQANNDATNCSITDIFADGKVPVFPSDVVVDRNGNIYVLWNGFSHVNLDKLQDEMNVRILTAQVA